MIPSGNITELQPGEIFVFGSNTAGKHGKGAAKQAQKWGAVWGEGEGLFGRTYGIPTKNRNLEVLPLQNIRAHVERFLSFAHVHTSLTFLVTQIGCGLAGYKPKDIAPMFLKAVVYKMENVRLPKSFLDVINKILTK